MMLDSLDLQALEEKLIVLKHKVGLAEQALERCHEENQGLQAEHVALSAEIEHLEGGGTLETMPKRIKLPQY